MFKTIKNIFTVLAASAGDALSDVPQDRHAVILGRYRGFLVRLVPVEGADGTVEEWVPNPEEAKRVDRILEINPVMGDPRDMGQFSPVPPAPEPTTAATSTPPPLPPLP